MQKSASYFWNMLFIHSRKVILTVVFLSGLITELRAQNLPQYDTRRLHFGFTLNGTYNALQFNTSPDMLRIDSLQNIRQQPFYGFGLGAIVDLKVNKYLNLRMIGPAISFAQRNLHYDFQKPEQYRRVEIESVYLDIPIEIKLKSERHWNTRFYVIAGFRYSYDLISNRDAPRSLNDPIVALNKNMYSYELGIGMDLYLPFFKLSPELKFSQSLNNMLVADELIYTKALSSIFPRVFTLSFHFE